MIGQTFSHYRIIKEIGQGGMGVVYLAEGTVLGRQVAIKTLTEAGSPGRQHFRLRFLREARAVSTLSHPHIATIHDYGETPDGQPYIVMEFIKGETLADLMLKESLTIPRSLEIIGEVAEALGEAHSHGIIHRDIKPSNIAINHRGEVKVLDFGLAKQIDPGFADSLNPERQTLLNTQTREGVIVGTPMYLSPEQALGVDVDRRSDLFSLGAVLYECLAGKPPFYGVSPMDICAKVIRDEPPPPSQVNADVPQALNSIALKALAKKPEERYQTAAELIEALRGVRSKVQGVDQPITRTFHAPRGTLPSGARATLSDIFKRPRLSVGYVVAGVVVISLFAFAGWRLTRGRLHQPTAESKQLYDKGVSALREGAYYQASRILERAVAADGEFALAHARWAEALSELDYTDKAKNELLSASRLVADRTMLDRTDALYLDAISATVTRDLLTPISAYGEIARLNPNDAHAYLDLGRAYESHDEIEKAIEQYGRASELDRNNPAPFLRLAVLYGRRQDLKNSNAAFDKADQLYEDNQNFEGRAEVAYQRGYLLSQRGELLQARNIAQEAFDVAKLAGNNYQQVRALLLLSAISYSSGDTAQGEQLALQALELARNNDMESLATQGLLDLGYALMIKRSYDESERYLRQAFELAQRFKEKRNEARANLLLGTLYIQREDADKGAPFIHQALSFYSTGGYRREVSRCMIMVGREQLLKGDFDGAVKTLDEQLQLAKQVEDPGQLARSQAEVAAALSKQDFYPQALIRYTESYELNKQLNNPMNIAFALLNRADMLARLGQYQEANAALDELKPFLDRLSSDNRNKLIWTAWSFLIRAQISLSDRRWPETKAHCQQALAVIARGRKAIGDPGAGINTEAVVKGTLGLAQVYAGEIKDGLRLCNEALRLAAVADQRSTDDADIRLILAEALLVSGDTKGALATAQQAQAGLTTRHREESEWRAWLLAARANQRLGNAEAMREQQSRALSMLADLERTWGTAAFASYLARSDIQSCRKQLAQP